MRILLTNDDGIYAPGLAAMQRALSRLGEVSVIAPATEQSGVGHSITFLTPLMAKEVFVSEAGGEQRRIGWAVEGSPADCVKLAIGELMPQPPDLVVSGINGGLNVGINVLYSGTVAAATEGALYELPSIAVSLEYSDHARFDVAAPIATGLIEQMLKHNAWQDHLLYNLNIPTSATVEKAGSEASASELHSITNVHITRMGVIRWPAIFEERRDPKDRRYYWATGNPPIDLPDADTDLAAIKAGHITLTPLTIDRTRSDLLSKMREWDLQTVPLLSE